VVARARGQVARDLREQRLDVAAAHHVEVLVRLALVGVALAGLARQPLREGAVDLELGVPGVPRHVLRRREVVLLLLLLLRMQMLLWLVLLRLRRRRVAHWCGRHGAR
jgi:hypothetical protein